jgi:hypothetical protein
VLPDPVKDTRDTATPPTSAAGYSWKSRTRRIVRKTIGLVLILLGLAALLTPLTPGSWLIPIGLELVGLRLLLQDRLLTWAKRHPNSKLLRAICRFMRLRKRDPDAQSRWRRSRAR